MSQPAPNPAAHDPTPVLHLHRWRDPVVLGVALCALASGFGQFGVVAALGDVARTFGHVSHNASLTDQAGLSGTELGIGLAIIRLSSIGALPLTGLADRFGRRRMLVMTVVVGLVATVAAAASPGYWWFVAVFALGRPFLSATNALSQVMAAEQTGSGQRARAVALVTAGYGVGAGLTAVIHSLASSALGFRGVFALAVVPLAVVPLVARWVTESDRYAVATAARSHPMPVIGAVGLRFRTRLLVLVGLSFMVAVVTGPANTFIFLYAQNVRHLAGGLTAAMVVVSGVAGLGGLLVGRWLADHVGRRPTGALGMVGIALCATLAYSGSSVALVVGYVLGVLAGGVFAPAAGAFVNELFPTGVRASVAGWVLVAGVLGAVGGLVAFGAVADLDNRFSLAAVVLFLPASLAAGLFWCVPETKGCEPEDLWPNG
ncbi:MAG TPA: MFS transporter [Acidimicrobiales bacterium]